MFLKITNILSYIAYFALSFMMFYTTADVIGRTIGFPLPGSYEISGICLAILIAFSMPMVSQEKGHVNIDLLLMKLSEKKRKLINTITRLLCFIVFILLSYILLKIGNELKLTGEVSPTIQVPFYFIVYGVSICCLIESFSYIFDIIKIWKGNMS